MIFFPLRDDNPVRITPWVTYSLIAVNVLVFLWQNLLLFQGVNVAPIFGLVPARLMADPGGDLSTVVTSMFLHGGWFHLGSNLWFLHVFGDNLEETFGRARYIVFYLVCGVAAAGAQVALDVSSPVPMIGASGAIAGVVGGYLVLFPRAPILSINIVPLLWLFLGVFVVVPAWLIAGLFFLFNLGDGLASLGSATQVGVAFFAHLGGFVAGVLITLGFVDRRNLPKRVAPRWRDARRHPVSIRRR